MKDIPNSEEVQNNKCVSGYCPKNCVLSYKLGKKIVKMLNKVDNLLAKVDNINIAQELPPKLVDEMPLGVTVGLDMMVDKVWNRIIEDENVGIIGLYGIGGARKTTLMERIHNEFVKKVHHFDLVLWVVVSIDGDINKIMSDIRSRLRIDDGVWNRSSQDQRAAMIYQQLKEKKFVLMLDYLWGILELEMVGAPIPKERNNESKVLFTTRFEDVCAKMQAQKEYKVECLSEQQAFDLFCKKVGDETLKCHKEIPKLANEMAKECGGLPLALITVGSAMAGVKSAKAWRQAKNDLRNSPWTASDLVDKVFYILKFSYDKLPDEAHKNCFLYCALYREDYVVNVDELIDRWIAEGFLGKDTSVYDMYEQGESIIEKFKLSCLLEGVDSDEYVRDPIKMHDVIRDMALWLARDQNKNKDKVVVQGEALALSEMDAERLNVVERISIIMYSRERWQVPPCQNLITLCVRLEGYITDYSNLQSMKSLKVLDLSGNFSLKQVPSVIGELINLEFFNLSRTNIRSVLPIELKNLKNLRVFLMEYAKKNLEIIPLEMIESLERLKVFRFSGWNERIVGLNTEKAFLDKLESLPKLEELGIKLTTITGMRKLLGSKKLLGCSRHFMLLYAPDPLEIPSSLASLSRMKHLDSITLWRVDNLLEGSFTDKCHLGKLRQVKIGRCNSITHLTWLRYAPLLEYLHVRQCHSIEQVVKEAKDEEAGSGNNIFLNLRHLHLQDLPELESIHKRALAFPSLKYIFVERCPNLRKLPFNSTSAVKDKLISFHGEMSWWDSLFWEDTDDNIIRLLYSKFIDSYFERL